MVSADDRYMGLSRGERVIMGIPSPADVSQGFVKGFRVVTRKNVPKRNASFSIADEPFIAISAGDDVRNELARRPDLIEIHGRDYRKVSDVSIGNYRGWGSCREARYELVES